jgi:ribosomal-protein-alanine N-acetyltransferase
MNDRPAQAVEMHPITILTTPRLILRTAVEQDIPIMHARIFGDSEVMRYVFQGGPMTEERAAQIMQKFFTFGDSLTGIAILADKTDDDIVGFAGLFPCQALGADDFEIGFVLARSAWGRGIATEIGEAQLAFGFEKLNCTRLLGLADPRNRPSIHALQKLGLRYLTDVTETGRANRNVFCIEIEMWRRRIREQRV